MKTLLIDHYDSFTYNLYHLLAEANGEAPLVMTHDDPRLESLDFGPFENVVVGPGPGHPGRSEDLKYSASVIQKVPCPVLGICLGHQALAHYWGGQVERAPSPWHGKVSLITHDQQDLFSGLPSPLSVVRYHSLVVREPIPNELVVQARSEDGLIMALRHRHRPLWGVQFHPESVGSEGGLQLLRNFRRLTEAHRLQSKKLISAPTLREKVQRPRAEPPRRWVRRSVEWVGEVNTESLHEACFAASREFVWLDSARSMGERGRYSILGDASGPYAERVSFEAVTQTLSIEKSQGRLVTRSSLWDFLAASLSEMVCTDDASESAPLPACGFRGGYVGYLSYEMGDEGASSVPSSQWIFLDRYVLVDHLEKKTYFVELKPEGALWDESWLSGLQECAARLRALPPLVPVQVTDLPAHRWRHSQEAYCDRVRICQEEMASGESYELCLTNQASIDPAPRDLNKLYRWLRKLNPAPFAARLKFPQLEILSSSPERLLSASADGRLEARPIKGTASRGFTEKDDQEARENLLRSPKNRAENLMIVDLLRHDLGCVAALGSVRVPHLMEVESFASVHQLVSTIEAQLSDECSVVEALRSAFPGGSMTGAPKKRSMEILRRVEGSRRGVYSGALGYLSIDGAMDMSIVIRTLVATEGAWVLGAGGSIVADSDPDSEYQEMLLKARLPLEAVGQALKAEGINSFS